MASYRMEGETLIWYQDAYKSRQFNSLETFTQDIQVRFGPTSYDDPMEALTRLKQTTFIVVYKTQFGALSNRLRSLSNHHKLSFFLSGLKDEIRLPIKMLNPISLSAAYGLAKILEEYLSTTKRALKPTSERSVGKYGRPHSQNQGGHCGEGSSRWQKPNSPTRRIS